MKSASNSNCFYSKFRLLLGLVVMLLSGVLLLASIGSMSSTFAARIGSSQAGQSNSLAVPSSNHFGSNLESVRRFDQQGNRAPGMSSLPLHQRHTRAIRPAGSGNWSSLGPPGMYSMLLFRQLIRISPWLASLRAAASAGRFTVLPTEATRGRKFRPWTAPVSSTSNSQRTALYTSAHRTVFGKARTAV